MPQSASDEQRTRSSEWEIPCVGVRTSPGHTRLNKDDSEMATRLRMCVYVKNWSHESSVAKRLQCQDNAPLTMQWLRLTEICRGADNRPPKWLLADNSCKTEITQFYLKYIHTLTQEIFAPTTQTYSCTVKNAITLCCF